MAQTQLVLNVTSILSRGSGGGVIFAGLTETRARFVAVCSYLVLPDASLVHKGQTWSVTGILETRNDSQQIVASSAALLRPAGHNVVAWIAGSPECAGIGEVKARRLYDRFGLKLLELIDAVDLEQLQEVVSAEAAQALCQAFKTHKVSSTLAWLDAIGIQRVIGQKIIAFFKEEARSKIEANPYRLTSFAEKWSTVDRIALQLLSLEPDDSRRFDAAFEEALSSAMTVGHTCVSAGLLMPRLASLLGSKKLAQAAMDHCGKRYEVTDGEYQSRGAHLIEQYVANRLRSMASEEIGTQAFLFERASLDEQAMDACIDDFQRQQDSGFELTCEQRRAVKTSGRHRVSLILGGAGTGKTTVLKALYALLEHSGNVAIYQLALAGRAAQRMSEATGRPSMTIASFLHSPDTHDLGEDAVVVVDEVSMVDVVLMYRLLRQLSPGVRLVLVGDPSQLPPIGPGLVLHALAGHPSIPQAELKVTKRQAASTGIPAIAACVRVHTTPEFQDYFGKAPGVSFLACDDGAMNTAVLQVFKDLGSDSKDVRILSTTRNGIGGVSTLNSLIHDMKQQEPETVWCFDANFGVVGARSMDKIAVKVGDSVMFTKNDYRTGLRNGSLGTVICALPVSDAQSTCCICEFEGTEYSLNTAEVYALTHAYAITIHKSQGSQFQRVIIPVRRSRLLDQTLIYTAITRAIEQVVIVGNMDVVRSAIVAPALSARRHIRLPHMLTFPQLKLSASHEPSH